MNRLETLPDEILRLIYTEVYNDVIMEVKKASISLMVPKKLERKNHKSRTWYPLLCPIEWDYDED